jgi:hypothetical protein
LKTWLKLHTVRGVSGQDLTAPTELSRLPRRDDWLILPTPATRTNRAAIDARAREHIRWPLWLERDDALFLCGPLLSGPQREPGRAATAIRVADEDAAQPIAARNSFVLAACGHSQYTTDDSARAASPSGSRWVQQLTTGDSRTRDHERQRCIESA